MGFIIRSNSTIKLALERVRKYEREIAEEQKRDNFESKSNEHILIYKNNLVK